jgi:hypothetical protein
MQIFETDHLRLILRPTGREHLVLTFSHMDFDHSGNRFWGEDAVQLAGFDAAGVVAKSNNWFPTADMVELAVHIRAHMRHYRRTILYGFSMGGYAAAKFSGLLRADSAIALSPQYSIDPGDVFHHDRRLVRHYNAGVNQCMAVAGNDLHGNIYLFCDNYVAEDEWNCVQIAAQAGVGAKVHLIHAPRISHETIDIFAGREPLARLLRSVLNGDERTLRSFTSFARRRCPRRIVNVLKSLYPRHRDLANRLFAQHSERIPQWWKDQWQEFVKAN